MTSSATETYQRLRPRLLNLAYRLTGTWADAEDVVADAWPRWREHGDDVHDPAGWLTTVVARLSLDLLRSARVRRERYVGPWLPEPVVHGLDGRPVTEAADDPANIVVLDESVRLAFLVVLDRLSPEQRVAFVLHDVVGLDFARIAAILECTVPAARQHASRGRRRVAESVPPPAPPSAAQAVLEQLGAALAAGDVDALTDLLTADVELTSDGAGRVFAARRVLVGAEVARFLLGLGRRMAEPGLTVEPVLVNGEPAVLMRHPRATAGQPWVGTYSFAVVEGRVAAVYAVLAPRKVGRYAVAEEGNAQASENP